MGMQVATREEGISAVFSQLAKNDNNNNNNNNNKMNNNDNDNNK